MGISYAGDDDIYTDPIEPAQSLEAGESGEAGDSGDQGLTLKGSPKPGQGDEGTPQPGAEGGEGAGAAQPTLESFDLSKVPEALRPQAETLRKSLLGDYTRKTQALAEREKALEGRGLNHEIVERLLQDPALDQFLQWRRSRGMGGDEEFSDGEESTLDGDGAAPPDRRVTQVQTETTALQRRVADLEAALFTQRHPDWRQHSTRILQLLEADPTMDYEKAYDLATSRPARAENMQLKARVKELEDQLKAKGSVEAGRTPTTTVMGKRPRARSFEDAVELARSALGMSEEMEE